MQMSLYPLRRNWEHGYLEKLQQYLALYLAMSMNEAFSWPCIVVENLQIELSRLPLGDGSAAE